MLFEQNVEETCFLHDVFFRNLLVNFVIYNKTWVTLILLINFKKKPTYPCKIFCLTPTINTCEQGIPYKSCRQCWLPRYYHGSKKPMTPSVRYHFGVFVKFKRPSEYRLLFFRDVVSSFLFRCVGQISWTAMLFFFLKLQYRSVYAWWKTICVAYCKLLYAFASTLFFECQVSLTFDRLATTARGIHPDGSVPLLSGVNRTIIASIPSK